MGEYRYRTIVVSPRWWQLIARYRRWRWLHDDSDVAYGDFMEDGDG